MSTISRTRAYTCQPFHPPHVARTRPARPPARPSPASRLPCCPQNFSHNLTHSLVISRHLSCISPALTQYEIRNSAPNLLRPPCRSLDHRINCTHSRKTKATADHLCTLTNVYCLKEQPQLQDHNAPAPDATRCAHPHTFFSERARQHMNSRGSSRHFAPMPPAHLRHTGTPPQLMRHCTAADCDPIRGDSLDEQLPWNGKPAWPEVDDSRRALSSSPPVGILPKTALPHRARNETVLAHHRSA